MAAPVLVIAAALEQELAGVRRALLYLSERERAALPVDCQVLGIGQGKAPSRVEKLLTAYRQRGQEPDSLLLVGFAGALDPALRPGDLVLPTRYCHPEHTGLEPAGDLEQQAIAAAQESDLRVSQQDSLTVDRLVTTPEAKADLARRYTAGIVDMEDYWVAQACAEAGVRFLAARAVLDPARQSLPGYLPGMAEHRVRSILSLPAQPWRVLVLVRLSRQMRLAQDSLARFVSAFICYKIAAASNPTTAMR